VNEGVRILFVDDEEKFVEAMGKVLINEGFSVDIAFSGTQALNFFEPNKYRLVITDLKMPIMDGIQLIRHIRQIAPAQKIVVVTAFPSQVMPWNRRLSTDTQGMDELGTLDYLVKPFPSKKLIDVVQNIINEGNETYQSSESELQQQNNSTQLRETPEPIAAISDYSVQTIKRVMDETVEAIGKDVVCALVTMGGKVIAEINESDLSKESYSGRFATLMALTKNTLLETGYNSLTESLFRLDDSWILTYFMLEANCYFCIVAASTFPLGTLRTIGSATVKKLRKLLK